MNIYREFLLEAALKEEQENDIRIYAAMKHETAQLYEKAQAGDEFAQAALETALDWWAIYFAFGEEKAHELKDIALTEMIERLEHENAALRAKVGDAVC